MALPLISLCVYRRTSHCRFILSVEALFANEIEINQGKEHKAALLK